MSRPRTRLLRFPGGHQLRSEDIAHVRLFPDLSPEKLRPYMQVFTAQGLFYEGFVDLERVAVSDSQAPAGQAAKTPAGMRTRFGS